MGNELEVALFCVIPSILCIPWHECADPLANSLLGTVFSNNASR